MEKFELTYPERNIWLVETFYDKQLINITIDNKKGIKANGKSNKLFLITNFCCFFIKLYTNVIIINDIANNKEIKCISTLI